MQYGGQKLNLNDCSDASKLNLRWKNYFPGDFISLSQENSISVRIIFICMAGSFISFFKNFISFFNCMYVNYRFLFQIKTFYH